jgi:hypothetical protein
MQARDKDKKGTQDETEVSTSIYVTTYLLFLEMKPNCLSDLPFFYFNKGGRLSALEGFGYSSE